MDSMGGERSAYAAEGEGEGAGGGASALTTKPEWTLDQIVDHLARWDVRWSPTEIPYTFYTTRPPHLSGNPDYTGFVAFSEAQKAATRLAMDLFADVANVTFVERADDHSQPSETNPRFTFATSHSTAQYFTAYANVMGSEDQELGDADRVWFAELMFNAKRWAGNAALGTREFSVLMHEMLHGLGFPHPGEYNRNENEEITYEKHAEYLQDSGQYTVLSYFSAAETGANFLGLYGSTPLLHDVAALQAIYGVNTTTRTGNTVYGFNSTAGRNPFDFTVNTRPIVCIWDAGGVDTLDLSGFATASRVDLAEGAFSDAAGLTGNISIAYGAVVENARGGAAADSLTGNAVANRLEGGHGDDVLSGLAGADVLEGGAGADALTGGDGLDTADYGAALAGVTVDLALGAQDTGGAGIDTLSSIEVLIGSGFADRLTSAGAGARLGGGVGNDVLVGRGGADRLEGGGGDDTVEAGAGADTLNGGAGADRLYGGEGVDTATYVAAGATVVADMLGEWAGSGEGAGDSFASIEVLEGSRFGDTLRGDMDANRIAGARGGDVLYGWGGADRLEGGDGDDFLLGGGGADALDGGAGVDSASYWTGGAVKIDRLSGVHGGAAAGDTFVSIERFELSFNADAFQGSAAWETVLGYAGADVLKGGEGDDILVGGTGADVLNGSWGIDTSSYRLATAGVSVNVASGTHAGEAKGDVLTSVERFLMSNHGDEFVGGSLWETIYGYAGDDRLDGAGGSDLLHGGSGRDVLRGGAGADRFVFKGLAESAVGAADRISDFAASAGDRVDLSAMDANSAVAGNQAFVFVSAFTGAGGEARLAYDAGANLSTLTLDWNGDKLADFALLLDGQVTQGQGWVL